MSSYNNLNDLKKAILEKAKHVMNTKGANIVKKTENKEIIDKVLNSYTPVNDQRRETGGIEDVSNMHHKIIEDSNSVTLSVTNDTPTLYDRDYSLNEAIVYGGDFYEYPYNNRDEVRYSYLKGRNYVDGTIERLKEDGELIDMLKKELGK